MTSHSNVFEDVGLMPPGFTRLKNVISEDVTPLVRE